MRIERVRGKQKQDRGSRRIDQDGELKRRVGAGCKEEKEDPTQERQE